METLTAKIKSALPVITLLTLILCLVLIARQQKEISNLREQVYTLDNGVDNNSTKLEDVSIKLDDVEDSLDDNMALHKKVVSLISATCSKRQRRTLVRRY